MNAPARIALKHHCAPAVTDPDALTPHPPAGNLCIVEVRLGFHALTKLSLRAKPKVPRVLIGFIHRPIRIPGNHIRGILQSTPEICNHAIEVVDSFSLRQGRPRQQDCARAKKRLDIIRHVAKARPNSRGAARFTAEPRERRSEVNHLFSDFFTHGTASPRLRDENFNPFLTENIHQHQRILLAEVYSFSLEKQATDLFHIQR